jgi:PadR family transcriptional regulator PadR
VRSSRFAGNTTYTKTPSQKIHSSANTILYQHIHDLTGFQRDLLYVIAGNEQPHRLALKDALDDYYDQDIQHGRLYPNLDTLVEKGLVEKGTIDQRTNSYELTRHPFHTLYPGVLETSCHV